ncbi:MAG: TonB-dependent receptor [Bacteroidia bacterium]
MRYFLGLLLFLILPWGNLWGQNVRISGKIVDEADNSSLGYAAVGLYQSQDSSLVGGGLADSLGNFVLDKIKVADYYLEVRFLGYESKIVSELGLARGQDKTLGNIALRASMELMEAVNISGRQSQQYQKVDRQVFDAGQFQNAQGGTASDVLRNLPSVSIDGQGEISVRGATGFIIMLNGKPVQGDPATILNQFPANAIDDIEVITTPSAQYDPDGKAGIINIKTVQGATNGFYLLVNGLWGLPSLESYDNKASARRYGGDLTLNYRQDKWDLSVGLDYRRNDVSGRRIGYVNTYLDEVLTEFPSSGERSFDRFQYSGRMALNYTPTKQDKWGISVFAGKRTQFRTADILYQSQQRTQIPTSAFQGATTYWELYEESGEVFRGAERLDSITFYNENLRVRRGDFLIGSLDYEHSFADKSSISLSALYERTVLGGPTDNTSLAWPNTSDTLQTQFNTNDNPLAGVRLQANYKRKLGSVEWLSGYQYRYLSHPGDFLYQDRDLQNDRWISNPTFTNRIELTRQIHSLYTQFNGKESKLSYQIGLRLEYMDRELGLAQPDTLYELRLLSPFPSVNLQYDLGQDWLLKGGYSRRIERTTTFKMTPFPEREHSETLEQGDAELLPEFIGLAELGISKRWGDNSVFATAYYRQVNNVINRVNTIYNDTILNRIYTNAGRAQAYGLEVGATLYPTEWWKLYLGTNVYNYSIVGDLFGTSINTSSLIYSINANMDFDILPTLKLQTGLNYLSARVTAQGVDSRFYNPFLSLRKTFSEGKIALSLQWQNIDMGFLQSNEQRITTWQEDFYTTTNYIYEVDILLLSLSFKLNQPGKQIRFTKSEFGDKEW